MDNNVIFTYIACIGLLFVLGKILIVPIKIILKLIFNSVLGAVTIFAINLIGSIWGFHIGVNILTAVIVGILGVPGAILLILLKILI